MRMALAAAAYLFFAAMTWPFANERACRGLSSESWYPNAVAGRTLSDFHMCQRSAQIGAVSLSMIWPLYWTARGTLDYVLPQISPQASKGEAA